MLARIGAAIVLAALLALSASACSQAAPPTSTPTPTTTASAAGPAAIVLPEHPRVYFFGDSWTNGASAAAGRGFPAVVGQALGWTVQIGPDNSGAGYVHTYNSRHLLFPERAAALPPIDADLVILQGGINDVPGPLTDFWNRAVLTARTLSSKAGGAPVVMVGPAPSDGLVPEGLSAVDFEEAGVAKQLGIHYISPVQERWFVPGHVEGLIDPDTLHPNTAGHAYYAGRLVADLTDIVSTSPDPQSTTRSP